LFAQFIAVAAQLILICDPALFGFIKAMTIRALEKEVLELPPKSRARFAEKIIESIDDYAGPEIEKAWTQEIGRRVEEIKSGKAKGIPAEEAMTKARRALHETRRLTSARNRPFTAGRVNQLIQEAMDSGPETTLTKKDFDAIFKRVLKKAAK
jgi:putative addiction module component (TIGR02574 family)